VNRYKVREGPLPWPTANPRAREEWEFRPASLPGDEVWWCHQYEMRRICQGESWREDTKRFRRESGGENYEAYWRKAEECFSALKLEEWPAIFYTLWPEWPNSPYLSVKPEERERRIKDWCWDIPEVLETVDLYELLRKFKATITEPSLNLKPESLSVETINKWFAELPVDSQSIGNQPDHEQTPIDTITKPSPNLDSFESLSNLGPPIKGFEFARMLSDPTGVIVAIRIPYNITTEKFMALVRDWFKRRQVSQGEPIELRGAATPTKILRADLCAIGFWRLVRSGLTPQQAILHTQNVSGKPLIADHPSAWTRALKRAMQLLGNI